MYKILYYDDEIFRQNRGADRYRKLLEGNGQLEVKLEFPPNDLSDISIDMPDAFLVDFDLKAAPAGDTGKPVAYFGSTLASEIRMRHPNCPIILITRPGIVVTEDWMQQLLNRSIDFDTIVSKESIDREPDFQVKGIVDLIEGHQRLAQSSQYEWKEILNLMGANEEEGNDLREASPPLEGKKWYIPSISRWIRNVVLKYPGILYDELHAAVRLGIEPSSFNRREVQDYFHSAEYTGIFGSVHKRWWRDRLLDEARGLTLKYHLDGPVLEGFAEAFERETSISLPPARCIVDDTKVADWVCYLYNKPVKSENSIPYYPDERPSIMDQARVSEKAIKEHKDFDEALVDADSQEIVREMWGLV